MKLVIGIVRAEKANEVLEALYRADVKGISLSRVQGHGGELDRVETYRGTTVKMELTDKVRFEIAVSDEYVHQRSTRSAKARGPGRSATARSSWWHSSRSSASAPARATAPLSRL